MSFHVKFIEASGARVVPILVYKPREYYQDILNKVNGVLLPGGGDLLNSPGFGQAGKIIFDLAVEMNENGDYFPIWGTCLGFEMLNFAAAKKMWMKRCSAHDLPLNIDFSKGFKKSKMFSNLTPKLRNIMQKENVTIHLHHWCITPENYTLSGLDKYFNVLAVNKDSKNSTFVSMIEAINYPFYGVTFHPERPPFDWTLYNISIPHTADAVDVSQFFGNFFINETRKNFHRFPSEAEETSALIYNYSPQIVGLEPSAQMYTF